MPIPKQTQVAGWREWLSLPELGIHKIKAKLDTGARTSALHAVRMKVFEREGQEWVTFVVHPKQRSIESSVTVECEVLEWRDIMSSNGHLQKRPVVVTEINWFGQSWPIELTLTNRNNLGFRMLLGREALRRRVTIDPGRSYFNGKPPRRRKVKKVRRKVKKKMAGKKKVAGKNATKSASKLKGSS